MLEITVPEYEAFNETTQEFITVPKTKLRLEHSLVSISKWEFKHEKPFFSSQLKTSEELIDYVRCMTINQSVNPLVYKGIGNKNLNLISEYIKKDHTATTFSEKPNGNPRSIITSEYIYYLMTAYNIPFDCQKWNFGRLMTLIRIASIENAPKKKMSTREIMSRNRALNKARRRAHRSRG